MNKYFKQELLAWAVGVFVGAAGMTLILSNTDQALYLNEDNPSDEYHIHADFLIQTNDTVHELGVAELMTTAEQHNHDHAHLHDDEGEVLHMHQENVSFIEFLESIDITMMDTCLNIEGKDYCETETESLTLFVNNEPWTDSLDSYVPQDLDRVLLYYGPAGEASISDYLKTIPDESCIYSGSCPERGIAPAENCGLTCEL